MDILAIITAVIDKFFPSANAKIDLDKQKLALELQKALLDAQMLKNQTDINEQEAKHESIFVAGWRPFIGWVCGCAFAFNYVVVPFLTWSYVALVGHAMPPLPELDMVTMMTLLTGMLGIGMMRSYDKKNSSNGKGGG